MRLREFVQLEAHAAGDVSERPLLVAPVLTPALGLPDFDPGAAAGQYHLVSQADLRAGFGGENQAPLAIKGTRASARKKLANELPTLGGRDIRRRLEIRSDPLQLLRRQENEEGLARVGNRKKLAEPLISPTRRHRDPMVVIQRMLNRPGKYSNLGAVICLFQNVDRDSNLPQSPPFSPAVAIWSTSFL